MDNEDQKSKDIHEDTGTCAECGVVLDPVDMESGRGICEGCEWDLRHFVAGEEA